MQRVPSTSLVVLLLATLAATAAALSSVSDDGPLRTLFQAWMAHHNISIPPVQLAHRRKIWADNHLYILAHNAGSPRPSYSLAHNRFSHLTFEEFANLRLGWTRPVQAAAEGEETAAVAVARALRGTSSNNNNVTMERFPAWVKPEEPLPAAVDWVAKGAVTPVKDQGQCGSCYSFSAVGAVEGAYQIQTGTLLELSMQEVVDCDDLDGGCQGGEMQQTFKWVQENGGLCLLTDYPYVSGETQDKEAVCRACPVVVGTAPESWTMVRRNSLPALQAAVAQQPVSVAVGASRAWMFYESGVFDGQCEKELNHGVLCVGYGQQEAEEGGEEWWKVKNSWGTGWGMEGYILLKRADGDKAAACGILQDASFPLLPSSSPSSPAVAVGQGQAGSAAARDCGGGTASFSSITITPTDVQKNQLVTVAASGVLTKPTLRGTYTLSVEYEGAQLYSHTGRF